VATVELTQDDLETTVTDNSMVVVDFWAPWCGPCKSFAPIYESVAEKYPDVVFAKINTEVEQAVAQHFQIRSIPTLMIFRDQVIIYAEAGMLPESSLQEVIKRARTLDMDKVRADIEAAGAAEKAQT
jgi:thioredoxin 1